MLIQGIRTFERKRSPRMIERMWSPRIVERTGPPGTVVSKRRHIKHRRAFECGHGCVTLLRVVGCSGGGCSRPGRGGDVRQLGDLRLPLRRWHWRCNFAWAEHLNANRGIFKRERARCTTSILVLWRRGRVAMGGGSGGEASSWADLALARARAACGVSARRMRCREARTKSPSAGEERPGYAIGGERQRRVDLMRLKPAARWFYADQRAYFIAVGCRGRRTLRALAPKELVWWPRLA